jgi:hypothetical protein
VEIAKGLNRYDLVEEVNAYKKKKGESYGTRYAKKKVSPRSEERHHFERTFDVMVTQMAVLEQQLSLLQTTLQQGTDDELLDEGMEIIQNSGTIAHNLASNLTMVHKKLAHRPRADSSASGSSDASSKRSSGEMESTISGFPLAETNQDSSFDQDAVLPPSAVHKTPAQHTSPLQNRKKPVPTPRSQKIPPSRPPYEAPIQESTGSTIELLPPSSPSRASRKEHTNGKVLETGSLPHPPLMLSVAEKTPPPVSEVTIEENDWTGDSGMGTGSGSTWYGTRDEWRDALKNPPPEQPEHLYTSIREDTRDRDQSYQGVDY